MIRAPIVFVILVISLFAYAQPSTAQQLADVDRINRGSTVVDVVATPLRDSPPRQGLLYSKGNQIGVIQTGEELGVIATQRINTPFRDEIWVQFEGRGWAYVGEPGKGSCCFRLR